MRRNALHFSGLVIGLLTFVIVSISATAGKAADEEHLKRRPTAPALSMLMATTATPAPTPSPVSSAAAELLHEFTIAPSPMTSSRASNPRTVWMEVTAYCPCKKCCGKNARGITASGLRVTHNAGLFVAADANLFPFHTNLQIPGYANGTSVPVLDRGGAIKGNHLDVFFPTHQEAKEWGRRMVEVTIVP
jgi:3D (Asp-Asp-Asp) domain-containing protein